MRYLIDGLVIMIGLILQMTLFAFRPLWGVTPDLLLIIVVSYSLLAGYRKGAYFGFIAGVLQEVFTSGAFGVSIVNKLISGYICGFLKGKVYDRSILIPVLVIAVATLLNQLLIMELSNNFMVHSELWARFRETVVPLTGYHSLLSLIIYPAIYLINRRY
ncbi:MAG: rod shape-determining protein MreD [Bacillota bacterium]